ncbi:protein of unknown function (DUF4378) [Orobanche hederae]
MSARTVPCDDMYENRSLRKQQVGCMGGMYGLSQLFGHHRFFTTSRRHKQKRLLLGTQHNLEPQNATNTVTVRVVEVQKQKPRTSKESSQATSSSLDHNRTNIPESAFQITVEKENGPLSSKCRESPQIRDVVKDSMYREARSVPIRSFTNNEQKVTVMKHTDSPRPLDKSKFEKPNATSYDEPARVFTRDDRPTLRRLSYDGRESRDSLKTKQKELPRFSLDSKASSAKCSGLDSRLNFLGQEYGSHIRISSIVAKLMGLDDFTETITTDEHKITKLKSSLNPNPNSRVGFLSESPTTSKEKKEKPTSFSSALNLQSSSVYAEMEKQVTALEFRSSGKELRALKQILEAMQKKREKFESQSRDPAELQKQKQCSFEDSCSSRDSLMWQRRKTYRHGPIKETCPPNHPRSSTRITKSVVKATMEKTHRQSHTEYRTRRKKKATELSRPDNNDMKEPSCHFSSPDKRTTLRNSGETYATSRRDFVMARSEPQQNVLCSSGRVRKHSSKKARENCSLSKNTKVNSTDFQLGDDRSELSSVRSESNNSIASHLGTAITSSASRTNPNCREKQNSVSTSKEYMPAVELTVTLIEQPSPVSVLDTAFYIEDSPFPVKKISTAFQDESPGQDEAEWSLANLNHFSDCTQPDPGYKYNQNSQEMSTFFHEHKVLKTEPSQMNQGESVKWSLVPDQRYINKILSASRLFKDACIMPTSNQLISSRLINPNIFHALEEIEEINGEQAEKNSRKELNQKMQRRIVFDTVNEILVRKITTYGAYTLGRKRMSSEGLVKELYLEMDHLCGMPYGDPDDEDVGSIRLLTADMKYPSEDWTNHNSEVPVVVLEIERLIFKDLINEVVTGEVEGLHDWPKKHFRQLFTT